MPFKMLIMAKNRGEYTLFLPDLPAHTSSYTGIGQEIHYP